VTYEEWIEQVPKAITADPLWSTEAYRKALFLHDLAWEDCEHLMHDSRGRALVGQLISAAGSVSANMEEGYGRGFSKDRDYCLRVSVGSSRETRGWYYRNRHLLPEEVLEHRLNLTSEVIALLVTELNKHRRA
jgi:four helix bundle protein